MTSSFQLKGSMFALSVLQLQNTDLTILESALEEKVKLAPQFFHNSPVIIDLHKLDPDTTELDLKQLKKTLAKHGLIPVGIRGGNESIHEKAEQNGLAIMLESMEGEKTPEPEKPKDLPPASLLITHPIRSGQQVYAQNGDLIVVSSVSPGAELLADGNIHVYGTLRGRALAGVNGDKNARIFCHRLEAELVAIAGFYKIFDDAKEGLNNEPKQIHLESDQIVISSL